VNWHLHFTPTSSSWVNLAERWFKELTDKRLRRGRLPFGHLDAVDVAFHGAGIPGQGQPGGDGVLVTAQSCGEGLRLWLAACGGDPFLRVPTSPFGHDVRASPN
jgi:hypothetical protein